MEQEDKELCEKPCNRMLLPVCGTDGEHYKMFSNPCELENQHCADGKCKYFKYCSIFSTIKINLLLLFQIIYYYS